MQDLASSGALDVDVFIGSYPLFKRLPEYLKHTSLQLHFAELPDKLIEGMRNVHAIEQKVRP